jgi:hypothetical protein
MADLQVEADAIAGFLEWAFYVKDWCLAGFDEDEHLWPVDCDIPKLLKEYYNLASVLDKVRGVSTRVDL